MNIVTKTWLSDSYKKDREAIKTEDLIFVCPGGSIAYGTNTEDSDVDIRGVILEPKSAIIGLDNFEQYESRNTDTVIYGFKKLINLLINCNPNVIEILGNNLDEYMFGSNKDIGLQLINNVDMFLSQRAIGSFGGYANQQLRRLINAIGRERGTPEMQGTHTINSINHAWSVSGGIAERHLLLNEDIRFEFDSDENLVVVFKSRHVDFKTCSSSYAINTIQICSALSEVNNIVKSYDNLKHRNRKKSFEGLNKHASHLIRLYLMGIEILEHGTVTTKRTVEHDLLMSIRNGTYMNDDGGYKKEFFDIVKAYEVRFENAQKTTQLPKNPDMKRIQEFVMEVNQYNLRR